MKIKDDYSIVEKLHNLSLKNFPPKIEEIPRMTTKKNCEKMSKVE
jgi:hypothetical protein